MSELYLSINRELQDIADDARFLCKQPIPYLMIGILSCPAGRDYGVIQCKWLYEKREWEVVLKRTLFEKVGNNSREVTRVMTEKSRDLKHSLDNIIYRANEEYKKESKLEGRTTY